MRAAYTAALAVACMVAATYMDSRGSNNVHNCSGMHGRSSSSDMHHGIHYGMRRAHQHAQWRTRRRAQKQRRAQGHLQRCAWSK